MPVLEVFDAPKDAPGQAALEAALGKPEVKARLSRVVCLRVPAEGDAGKAAADRLAKVGADAKAPCAAAWKAGDGSLLGAFAFAALDDAKAAEGLAKLLDEVAPPPATSEPKKEAGPAVPPAGEKKEGPPAPGTEAKPADGTKPMAEPGK
jgi:hypothetical protein